MRARHAGLAVALAAAAFASHAGDASRGAALYDGRAGLLSASGDSAPACVRCHRPSGLGNFEGGLAVPPIAGPTLFAPYDPDTARYFARSSRYRVRPAYDEAALGTLLREGRAPDGVTMRAEMPRYRLDARDLADLAAHLRGLSAGKPVGIDAETVRIATISTPQADPARRDAMLAVLERFVTLKNGRSRHEPQRVEQASRVREMVMYRKYRHWQLEHWALEGEPAGWPAQLEAHQARSPVYAVVAGIGGTDWAPVDDFCARHRVPCLLPIVDAAPPSTAYALRYHAGRAASAALVARALVAQGLRTFRFAAPADAAVAAEARRGLEAAGLREAADGEAELIVSALAPREQRAWLDRERPRVPVLWLAGDHALDDAETAVTAARMPRGWIVTPMLTGAALERQLARTRAWLRAQGLASLPADVAASSLFAATALGEGLTHIDFAFTPEYLLELLEHGLENLVPWSPYPRLAIGPGQRVASKGVFVGEVAGGRVDWRWTPWE